MSRDTKYLTYHTTLVLDVNADSPKVVHSNSLVASCYRANCSKPKKNSSDCYKHLWYKIQSHQLL